MTVRRFDHLELRGKPGSFPSLNVAMCRTDDTITSDHTPCTIDTCARPTGTSR